MARLRVALHPARRTRARASSRAGASVCLCAHVQAAIRASCGAGHHSRACLCARPRARVAAGELHVPRVRPGTRAHVVVSHAGADAPARARARGLHAPADAHGTSLRLPRRQTAACTHPAPHPPRAPPQRCPRRAPRVARRARPPPRASSRPTRPSLQPPPPRAATCGRAYGARRARATRDSPPLQPHPPSVPPPCPLTHPHCALPARAPKAARRARRQNELTLQTSHKCKIIWFSFYPNSTQTLVPYEFACAPLRGDFCHPHLTRARSVGERGPLRRWEGRAWAGWGGGGAGLAG